MGKHKSKSSKSKKKKTVTASFSSSKKTQKSRVGSKFNTKLTYQKNKAKSRSSKKASKDGCKSPGKPSSIQLNKTSNTNVIKAEDESANQQSMDQVSDGSVVAVEVSKAEQVVNEESNQNGFENEELEKLEFTKPTINQIKKETREQSLRITSRITSTEFEQLFEEVSEKNAILS